MKQGGEGSLIRILLKYFREIITRVINHIKTKAQEQHHYVIKILLKDNQ
jgi:hypothetical protein